MTSPNMHDQTPKYHCVHCMTPSDSTYRTFGREIKLTTCRNCGQNVDPYVERDWLLVAMDCILLREEAYRHVLCLCHPSYTAPSPMRLWLGSALFQGYLYLPTPGGSFGLTMLVEIIITRHGAPWYQPIVCAVYAFGGNLLLFLGVRIASTRTDDSTTFNTAAAAAAENTNQDRLALAILLPTWFHGITIFVLVVWENTPTVRQLATLLVLGYQSWTTMVALQLQWQLPFLSDKPTKTIHPRFQCLGYWVVGVLVRAIGLAILRWLIRGYTTLPEMECLLGITVAVPNSIVGSGIAGEEWSLCLC